MEKVSSDVLRSAAPSWSLGGDQKLLDLLHDIHQKIMTRCVDTNTRLGQLVDSLDTASVDLQNVNNKFMALSNSQFVECRVYDDDIDVVPDAAPPKEEQKQAEPDAELVKMKQCLLVLESLHEPIQILESDSSDDDEERVVLKPRDMYSKRPLPYIIGSDQWKKKWHAGLVAEDSDSDSAGWKSAPREEYSDSEPEITETQTDKQIKDVTISSSNASFEASLSTQSSKPKPADIAAELARRLGGDAIPPPPTIPDVPPERPQTVKVYRPHQPATATLFPNEPPPLDQCEGDGDSDDDIFAELHKNRYTHNDKVRSHANIEDLFGDGSENRVSNATNKQIFADESEPEMFVEKPKDKTPDAQKDDGFKKPVGGISLFGSNRDSDSIGAAILKRNQRKSSSDEDNDPVPPKNDPPKIPAHPTVPKNVPPKNIVEELFVKPKTKKSTASNNIKEDVNKQKHEKEQKTKVDLFSDDIFDDIDDIFTSKVVLKKPEVKTKSIFDDDLFSDIAGNKKEKTKHDKSIFDSDDDLFSDVPASKPETSVTGLKVDVTNTNNNKPAVDTNENSSKSHVPSEHVSQLKPESNVINDSSKNHKSIFDDDSDDDIFKHNHASNLKTSHIKSNKKSEERNSKSSKQKSIFDDSDDELFGENVTKSKQEESKRGSNIPQETAIKSAAIEQHIIINKNVNKEINENQSKLTSEEASNKSKLEEKVAGTSNKNSIFDDDSEEELFGAGKSKQHHAHSLRNNIENNKEENFSDLPKASEFLNNFKKDNITEPAGTKIEPSQETTEQTHKNKDDLFIPDINKSGSQDGFSKLTNKKLNIPKSAPFESPSMFDDDEMEDLFSNTVQPTETEIIENLTEAERNVKTEENDTFTEKSTIKSKESIANEETKSQDEEIFNTIPQPTAHKVSSSGERSITEELTSNTATVNNNETSIENNFSADKEANINNIETPESVENDRIPEPAPNQDNVETHTNKPDIFSDIFNDMPPDFEKLKEPKRSKNVNALFDDDSDDEASFFKKDDVVQDDAPVNYDTNERFSIFHDEPPAVDVDFIPKPIKTTKISSEQINDSPKIKTQDNIEASEQYFSDETLNTELDSRDDNDTAKREINKNRLISNLDESIRSTNAMISEKINKIRTDINKIDDLEAKPKSVRKLKPMNFNINVNTLLPGSLPKKSKTETVEDVDGLAASSFENPQIPEEIDNKEAKTVNFEDEKESEILNNKISKERAKIQVKRRPSTRRARKEAARKSGIDFGDNKDSTDNSSSVDETKHRTDIKDSINSNIEHSKNNRLTKESESVVENIKRDIENNVTSTFNNNETVNYTKLEAPDSTITKCNRNITSKVVYILNDEDIFNNASENIDKSKNETNSDIFEPISTLASTYTDKKEIDSKPNIDKKASIFDSSDSDGELFGAKKKIAAPKAKLFDSDSGDDLFGKSKKQVTVIEKESKQKASLFEDESDDDIFTTKSKKNDDKISPPKESSKNPSEPVFEDPLSMFNQH